MKNSGVEWIGEIPEDWEVKKVKHSFVRKNEKAMQENPIVLSLARSGVRERDISNNEGQLAESYYNYNPVDVDDLLINPMDLYSGANCSISKVKGVISPAYINLRAKKNVSPVFYDYYFKVQYWMMAFFAHGNGVSFENRWTLNNETLQNYPIVAPSFETQQRIATYLDKKCSKIEETIQNQQQVIEKLKAYKQSLITEAVTGKVKIENGKVCGEYESYKDSGVEWIGKIPSGWEIKKAKYFIKISNGSDPKTEEGDTPVYGSGAESFKTCVEFKEGPTVLIGRKGATLHIPHYIEGNYWNVDTAFDVKTYSEEILLLKFYYYCATAFDYRFYLTSTTLPSMTQTNYGNMYLPVPNTLVQKEIVEFLDNKYNAIDTAIEQKQKLIEKLTEYKKSLIYECVTGKKEVN